MYSEVKIHNWNRINKHEFNGIYGKNYKDNTDTSTFVSVKKFHFSTKFNYTYNPNKDPQIIKSYHQQFNHNIQKKFQNGQKMRSKGLGRKDKYQRNLQTGKFLKTNPILTTFKKIDQKIVLKQTKFAFNVLKYLLRQNKLH